MRRLRSILALVVLLLVLPVVVAEDLEPASKSIAEVVDHYIERGWQEQGIKPAPLVDDATMIRRLTLDLTGRIPTTREWQEYVSSTDPNKKTKLVDRLLETGAFQRHQVNELEAMLAAPQMGGGGRRGGGGNLRDYLVQAVKENRGWDTLFRDLMLADEQDPRQKGASTFLKSRIRDLDRLTTDVSVLFFGVNISCAQCHDHPLVDDWKQDHYFGMKSFFARTYEAGQYLGERDVGVVEFKTTKNVSKTAKMMFLTGKVVDAPGSNLTAEQLKKLRAEEKKRPKEKNQAGNAPPPAPKFSARKALIELALQPDQRDFFAKAITNRVWHRLFGLGLVTPIDQMHSENAPSHPELLEWLARDTAEHGYDLKRLIRGLVLSRTYARSSRWEGERWPPVRSFAVARLRALTPMQLATSLRLATMDPEEFPSPAKAVEFDRKIEELENAACGLASQLEMPRDDFQISVSEALLFSNNERIARELLSEDRGRLLAKLKHSKHPEQALDLAAKAILNRPLTVEEKKAMVDYLAERQDRPMEAYRQMVWALLTSAEFRFNY